MNRIIIAAVAAVASLGFPALAQDVITQHNDINRTGWNGASGINPAIVGSSNFGIVTTTPLDALADAQPLVYNGVVYVATENDTVYAIDGVTGARISSVNFGAPVAPNSPTCKRRASGINSTPVIDGSSGFMYVVTYTQETSGPTYTLRKLRLPGLAQVASTVISASVDGFAFDPVAQKQHAGLLLSGGVVYTAFASFCDNSTTARGWVFGHYASTLAALPSVGLLNQQTEGETPVSGRTSDGVPLHDLHLTSIWQSGNGLVAGPHGDLFFLTGNSDTTRGGTNLQESAVHLSSDLSTVKGYFTPYQYAYMDVNDLDFSSGGIMLIPGTSLLVAAGKTGVLYVIDAFHMGGLVPGGPDKPPAIQLQPCWCAPAYFKGSDGVSRVVTSQGSTLDTWRVDLSANPPLSLEGTASLPPSIQDPGFFTSVSSESNPDGSTLSNSEIIWATGRPTNAASMQVTLYAFSATPVTGALQMIYSNAYSSWPYQKDVNITPTVANGHVYVVSWEQASGWSLVNFGSR